ncbi:MAG: PA14 domain-containing protein [Verrucomicrobia bacterium]|nr:PA14 domain-containing protein [Verrucomicrobiota bacterium]
MSSFPLSLIRRSPVWVLLLSACLLFGGALWVKGDPDMNVTKAVWKSLYGVTDAQINDQAWLGRDDDGDGMSNGSEIIAGTHPFSPGSVLKVSSMNLNGGMVNVTVPTQNGKLYILQVSPSLTGASWAALTPNVQIIGNGNTQTLSGTASGTSSFYRVLVQDVDSASDQVGDWAKKVLGYAPGTPIGSQSSYDHTQLATNLQSQNVISLMAVDASTTQPADAVTPAGDVGVITVQRSGYNLLMPITVPLSKAGSAVEGTDYAAIPSAVTFPAGVNSMDIKITPLYNPSRLTSCVVTLTAGAPGSAGAVGNYTLSPLSISAGVTINPSGNPTGTGLTGNYWVGASTNYASSANFGGNGATYTYTKVTSTTGTAVITYTGTTGFSTSSPNNRVNMTFSAGSLAGGTYDGIKTITAVSGQTITLSITGAAVPNSQAGSAACLLNPPVVTRLDPTVAFSWLYGSPNGTNFVAADNYSVAWDGYLSPSTAGTYVFQLDADDKARVYLDTGGGLTQILENGWDTTATGAFKQSGQFTLAVPAAPANRYHMRVEFVETTGNAKCKFQWQINGGTFANIPSTNIFTNNTGSTAGWTGTYYANTTLTAPVAGTQTDSAITNGNNGEWGAGSPDPLIYHNYFCCRWTGQMLPQYSETYTIIVNADDTAKLWINGQPMVLRRLTSDNPSVTYTYTQNSSTNGTIVLPYTSAAINVGDVIPLKFTTGNLSANYNISLPYTVSAVTPGVNFSTILTGMSLPASGTGSGTLDTTNLPVDWAVYTGADRYATIALQAGVLYDIKLETCEFSSAAGATLSWYSPSQSKQAIPTSRLFPTMTGQTPLAGSPPAAPPSITSATNVVTMLNSGSPFSLKLTANNGAGTFTASRLPARLTLNNGV